MPQPDPALPAELETGYRRFRDTRYAAERERYRQLGEGTQSPSAMIIACSDSHSGLETVFDAGPGELFVVRNVAALVPVYAPDTGSHAATAALEYAVFAPGVRSIVVMGHGRRGGITAALEELSPLSSTDFVRTWVAGVRELAGDLHPSDADDPARRLHALEHRSIEHSITNLRTFPWIASREISGALSLHGAWFEIAFGELDVLTSAGWSRLPGP